MNAYGTSTRPKTPFGLTRPRDGRLLAGVAAGLAERFGISHTKMRIIFLVSCILPGTQVLLYLLLWLIIPSDD